MEHRKTMLEMGPVFDTVEEIQFPKPEASPVNGELTIEEGLKKAIIELRDLLKENLPDEQWKQASVLVAVVLTGTFALGIQGGIDSTKEMIKQEIKKREAKK